MFDFTNSSGSTDFAPSVTACGGGMNIAGNFLASRQSADLMRANAGIAGMQALSEEQAGAMQAEMYRQRLNQTIGRQTASVGGANITQSGSALRSIATTASLGSQDIARTQLNASRKAWGFQVQQTGDLYRANQDTAAGNMNALGGLITTGAKAYGQWSDNT